MSLWISRRHPLWRQASITVPASASLAGSSSMITCPTCPSPSTLGRSCRVPSDGTERAGGRPGGGGALRARGGPRGREEPHRIDPERLLVGDPLPHLCERRRLPDEDGRQPVPFLEDHPGQPARDP